MYQLIALFKQPSDPEAFDKAYWETHVPLVKKTPGLISLDVSKLMSNPKAPAPYYQIATLSFADKDGFRAAMKSPENEQAGLNLMSFARGIVEFCTAEKVDR
jgi:uncharacterized protein (TIGR02118 family)